MKDVYSYVVRLAMSKLSGSSHRVSSQLGARYQRVNHKSDPKFSKLDKWIDALSDVLEGVYPSGHKKVDSLAKGLLSAIDNNIPFDKALMDTAKDYLGDIPAEIRKSVSGISPDKYQQIDNCYKGLMQSLNAFA